MLVGVTWYSLRVLRKSQTNLPFQYCCYYSLVALYPGYKPGGRDFDDGGESFLLLRPTKQDEEETAVFENADNDLLGNLAFREFDDGNSVFDSNYKGRSVQQSTFTSGGTQYTIPISDGGSEYMMGIGRTLNVSVSYPHPPSSTLLPSISEKRKRKEKLYRMTVCKCSFTDSW